MARPRYTDLNLSPAQEDLLRSIALLLSEKLIVTSRLDRSLLLKSGNNQASKIIASPKDLNRLVEGGLLKLEDDPQGDGIVSLTQLGRNYFNDFLRDYLR